MNRTKQALAKKSEVNQASRKRCRMRAFRGVHQMSACWSFLFDSKHLVPRGGSTKATSKPQKTSGSGALPSLLGPRIHTASFCVNAKKLPRFEALIFRAKGLGGGVGERSVEHVAVVKGLHAHQHECTQVDAWPMCVANAGKNIWSLERHVHPTNLNLPEESL